MRRSLVLFSSRIIKLSCRKSHACARSAPSRLRYPAKTGARPGRHRHGPGLAALASGGLDFDHPRHRSSRRGDPHLEHAVRVLRLHLGAVDALGEREAPLVPTVRDLKDYFVREVAYGGFQRSFSLPEGVDGAQVEAKYANGMLEVRIPAPRAAVPRMIEVKAA